MRREGVRLCRCCTVSVQNEMVTFVRGLTPNVGAVLSRDGHVDGLRGCDGSLRFKQDHRDATRSFSCAQTRSIRSEAASGPGRDGRGLLGRTCAAETALRRQADPTKPGRQYLYPATVP